MTALPLPYALKSRDDALAILEDRDSSPALKFVAWKALKSLKAQGFKIVSPQGEPGPEAA